jgi:long-chain acyl-CoA synthetase
VVQDRRRGAVHRRWVFADHRPQEGHPRHRRRQDVPPANIEQRFADDPFIAQVVVYGDGQKYLVAGVWLNEATVEAHLKASGVTGDRTEATRALVQQRIDKVNAQLASYETLKKFAIIPQPLTVEGGLLTPTLKVKRKKVYEAFRNDLEALYAG